MLWPLPVPGHPLDDLFLRMDKDYITIRCNYSQLGPPGSLTCAAVALAQLRATLEPKAEKLLRQEEEPERLLPGLKGFMPEAHLVVIFCCLLVPCEICVDSDSCD